MILKRKRLHSIVESLDKLASKDLPVWYELSLNIKAIRDHYIKYQIDVDAIFDKYGTKKENGTVDWGNNNKLVVKEFEKVNELAINVSFVNIDIDKVRNLSLPAGVLEPLLDVIFFNYNNSVETNENSVGIKKLEEISN